MTALTDLKTGLGEVFDLSHAAGLLSWDQDVMMPPGGVEDRAEQMATVLRIAHERFTSDETGRLLERAERELDGEPYESDNASLLRVTRRERDQAMKLPRDLVAELARASAISRPVWMEARQKSDWTLFQPRMEVTVELTRQVVEALGYPEQPYDALIDLGEPGMTTREVADLFDEVRAATVPLVRELVEHQDRVDDSVLDRPLDEGAQLAFALDVAQAIGYSLESGRLDVSAHPFTSAVARRDVRITTRVRRNTRDSCLFSTVHEAGHGLYYLGIPLSLGRTPICDAASYGVNESQSRLWENQVGRSLPFWRHFFPQMRDRFPEALADQDAESYFRAINKVRPSYIRVDADEVTYNLHVLLRFELERDLVGGRLRVADVPEAWNAKLKEYLGLDAPEASNGCLQDIHWTFPQLGEFVGYTLGNVIAAQLMQAARRELPDLDEQFAQGSFLPLLGWLQANVHVHGRKFPPKELVEKATGNALDPQPLVRYLETKFRSVYGLPLG